MRNRRPNKKARFQLAEIMGRGGRIETSTPLSPTYKFKLQNVLLGRLGNSKPICSFAPVYQSCTEKSVGINGGAASGFSGITSWHKQRIGNFLVAFLVRV